MSAEAKQGYQIFTAIRHRSKKQSLPLPTFGPREFIGWWTNELKSFSGKRPTCGRIDHAAGYSWDNILMQDSAANSLEMAIRTRAGLREKRKKGKRVYVYLKGEDVLTGIFPTVQAAADFFKISRRQVGFIICNKRKSNICFDLRSSI